MLCLWNCLLAHITLNPNPNESAESGSYFHTTLRVPHGAENLHTTSLTINVPHGILVAQPEIPFGWTANIENRNLKDNEQYVSHGTLVKDAPKQLILTADSHEDGVHDDYLLNIDIQMKIGCIFDDIETNSLWNKEFTLWWTIEQVCEDAEGNRVILNWNGIQKDNDDGTSPSWSALPRGILPAPYLYIEPGLGCSIDNSGNELNGGLMWFGVHKESDILENVHNADGNLGTIGYITLVISIIGLVLSSISIAFLIFLSCIRFKNKKKFTEKLIGVEYCACKELASTTYQSST